MTQKYKIICEVIVSVDDVPIPQDISEGMFTRMLQNNFKGHRVKVLNVVQLRE